MKLYNIALVYINVQDRPNMVLEYFQSYAGIDRNRIRESLPLSTDYLSRSSLKTIFWYHLSYKPVSSMITNDHFCRKEGLFGGSASNTAVLSVYSVAHICLWADGKNSSLSYSERWEWKIHKDQSSAEDWSWFCFSSVTEDLGRGV